MTFDSQVIMITGAVGGIGEACVRKFADAGALVAIVDVQSPSEKLLACAPDRIASFKADVSCEADVSETVRQIIARFGRLDVLINNAAILAPTRPVQQTTEAEMHRLMSVNIGGTFLCCRLAYRYLKQSQGNIVNVSSMAGLCGEKSHAAYAMTKGAINALTKSIAVDWGGDGIRCNAVCPAAVSTPSAEQTILASSDAEAILQIRRNISPLGKVALPEQVADVILFLASKSASHMTGAIIPISGGSECGYGLKY